MNPYVDLPNKKLVFKKYSTRPHRYKFLVDSFIQRFSDCPGASTSNNDTVIFDGISHYEASTIRNIIAGFGCYTVIENTDRRTPNAKREELSAFLEKGAGALRCLRCGSSRYTGDHGLFGTHPSRWRCRDCGCSWEY